MTLHEPPPIFESANTVMARAISTARQVAASDVPVLLAGESGTGKHVLAAAIHGWSRRREHAFVTVPRIALANDRHEGELFPSFEGVEKDSCGRLSAADGGTVFFEEVGDLSLAQQATLARFLDEHRSAAGAEGTTVEVDVRVIAATNRNLEADVRSGHIREDLFFRLSVVNIALPPLRVRKEDLPALTEHFLTNLAARYSRGALHLAAEVQQVFARYPWPGNVRELQGVLERAVVLSRGDTITTEDLPERLLASLAPTAGTGSAPLASLHELERQHIARVIKESPTLEDAAIRLGIDPTTLWRKRKRYGLR
jgi:NtrC-family two-component system response regulator AlgB